MSGSAERSSLPFELEAYLACGLTGLTTEERDAIYRTQELVDEICRSIGIKLYLPKNFTDPLDHKEVSPENVFFTDRQRVLESDLLIAMVCRPSFGVGQELEIARNALIPIILLTTDGITVSRMVRGIPSIMEIIEYRDETELRSKLPIAIQKLFANVSDQKSFASQNK